MARSHACTFTVEGKYQFPTDMLRKDECWPVDTLSAHAITDSIATGGVGHTVKLASAHLPMGPNDARWASFGWHVTQINDEEPHMFYGRKAA